MAPSTSISKMAGSAMRAISGPKRADASANCDTISSAMDDIGVMAHPTHSACLKRAPLPTLASATPIILASARASTRAATSAATGPLQSACAATVDTSTNISMTRMDDAVPSWRGQAHGRGLSCLSSTPPISAARGADAPRCAASAAAAAIRASSSMAVFSLVGLIMRSAPRKVSASKPPTANETPKITTTG